MKADYTITVWHFKENDVVPERKIFKNVAVSRNTSISKNGIKQKGFFRSDRCSVRIFTETEIEIVPGDYLCIGEYNDTNPIREICHKVIELRDNRLGGKKHWHIVCGG